LAVSPGVTQTALHGQHAGFGCALGGQQGRSARESARGFAMRGFAMWGFAKWGFAKRGFAQRGFAPRRLASAGTFCERTELVHPWVCSQSAAAERSLGPCLLPARLLLSLPHPILLSQPVRPWAYRLLWSTGLL